MTRWRWIATRVWTSPTITTWGSFASRLASLTLVLPLILRNFPSQDVTLWYVFSTIIGLQVLIDLGFYPTFVRVIGYAIGGMSLNDLTVGNSPSDSETGGVPQPKAILAVVGTINIVYAGLGITALIVTGTLGSAFVAENVRVSSQPGQHWLAWGIVVCATALSVWAGKLTCILQGLNEVALVRRWETIINLVGIVCSCLSLVFGGGILALVAINQGTQLVGVVVNWGLCNHTLKRKIGEASVSDKQFEPKLLKSIWPNVWRSGVGILMSYGIIQSTGLLVAKILEPAEAAAYLIALRLVTVISQFSQAPFYSKLPVLAKLKAEHADAKLVAIAGRGMRLSYWVFTAGVIGVAIAFPLMLQLIGSKTHFVSQGLWALLAAAIFVERFGAMHMQLYSTTNHILWHVANGVTGVAIIAYLCLLLPILKVYAIPVSIFAGYMSFYSWYAAQHSYAAFGLRFLKFERSIALPPAFAMATFFAVELATSQF